MTLFIDSAGTSWSEPAAKEKKDLILSRKITLVGKDGPVDVRTLLDGTYLSNGVGQMFIRDEEGVYAAYLINGVVMATDSSYIELLGKRIDEVEEVSPPAHEDSDLLTAVEIPTIG